MQKKLFLISDHLIFHTKQSIFDRIAHFLSKNIRTIPSLEGQKTCILIFKSLNQAFIMIVWGGLVN